MSRSSSPIRATYGSPTPTSTGNDSPPRNYVTSAPSQPAPHYSTRYGTQYRFYSNPERGIHYNNGHCRAQYKAPDVQALQWDYDDDKQVVVTKTVSIEREKNDSGTASNRSSMGSSVNIKSEQRYSDISIGSSITSNPRDSINSSSNGGSSIFSMRMERRNSEINTRPEFSSYSFKRKSKTDSLN